MASIWITNLVYLIYFFRRAFGSKEILIEEGGAVKKVRRRLIPQTMFRIKLLTQEICVATITTIMFMFSLTEGTAFSSSKPYWFLEQAIILFIIFAVVSEFLWVVFQTIHQIFDSTKKQKLKKTNTFYLIEAPKIDSQLSTNPNKTEIEFVQGVKEEMASKNKNNDIEGGSEVWW